MFNKFHPSLLIDRFEILSVVRIRIRKTSIRFGPRIREEIDVNRMLVKTGDDQLPSGGHLLDPSTRAAEISRKLIIINPCDACPVNEYLDTFRSSYHCLQLRVSLPRTKPLSHRL